MGRGLSPSLTPFPSGPKAPSAYQNVSPPAPTAPTPQVGPEEGRKGWKWELLTEKPSAPSSLPSQPNGAPLRDHAPSCPWQEKGGGHGPGLTGG